MSYMLEGLKVIDAASYLAAPGAATIMADYGADVIKVEAPQGDAYRRLHGRYHHDFNWSLTSRNKRDIGLDLNEESGISVLHRLIDTADVLLINFREDQVKKYKLEFEALKKRNPRLIYAQFTGFGTVGPEKSRPGYDVTGWWARTGIMDLGKGFGEAPTYPVGGVGDHASAMTLFGAVMLALYSREKTGQGKYVSTSLVANGCWANGMHLQGAIAGYDLGEILDEKGYRNPFVAVYKTRDERFVVIVLNNPEKEWPRIASSLGHTEWVADARFGDIKAIMKQRDMVKKMFSDAFAMLDLSDVCAALEKEKLTYAAVERISDVVKDAHLIENEIIVQTQSDNPDYQWAVANPIKIHGEAQKPAGDAPAIGEHTREILLQAGFPENEIELLLKSGVVV
ncbi:MAG: CoA transferase [Pseudomonadales bacterium]|nr:CoA transferase [Pseudomonadales bacterium]